MARHSPGYDSVGFPPLTRWIRDLLVALVVMWVVELCAVSFFHVPAFTLAWFGFEQGFRPWQLATRYLVQGSDVSSFIFGALALFFALPALDRTFSKRQWGAWLAATVIGGTVIGLVLNRLGIVSGTAFGWSVFAGSAFTALGLAHPEQEIRLFFVLPVRGTHFAWGTGAVSLIFVLANRSLGSADMLGAWAGVMGWWHLFGPGARRRTLVAKGKQVERRAQRFRVVEGGRQDDPQHWN